MSTIEARVEVHDADILKRAREVIDDCAGLQEVGREVIAAVDLNARWRGEECINLLAPEAPTSPGVRALLSAEIGTRAAEGHIGRENRWFAGTRHIDEVESLCVELLKKVFHCEYADHRMCASMIGNAVVYSALTDVGDTIMSVAPPVGGHSSNRRDGPAGSHGLKIVDIPVDSVELEVDLDRFNRLAPEVRPKLVALGLTTALFPFPIQQMAETVSQWGGKIFFDGAHQLGLVAAGFYQDPLKEGADIVTGSAGKTFSGPQSGIILWDDPSITKAVTDAVFPIWAATHQVNRVAALAYSAAEFLEYGEAYMNQIVKNAQALGEALQERGIPMLASHKGFTRTHQVIADVRKFGGGLEVARQLESANIITNKNLLPTDSYDDWANPGGLRIGTIEVTRLGMREEEMKEIADFIARLLVQGETTEKVGRDVLRFRSSYQTLYYCFEHGLPE